MSEVLLVLSNFPDRETALHCAETLAAEHLAACINLLGPCTSVYRWQGKLEQASEVPLLIKTTRAAYPALEARLRALHPYELPEIIALPLAAGLPDYLDWVSSETGCDRALP